MTEIIPAYTSVHGINPPTGEAILVKRIIRLTGKVEYEDIEARYFRNDNKFVPVHNNKHVDFIKATPTHWKKL